MLASMEKVVIAGAGLTGAVTGSLIRKSWQDKLDISVWDKSRGTGGRMGTSRSPDNNISSVDLGAQYISATPGYLSSHKQYYDELEAAGILRPLTGTLEGANRHVEGSKHFVPPNGMGSIAKYFLSQTGSQMVLGERITTVNVVDKKWSIVSERGKEETCDCLILTMPVPQILELKGSIRNIIESQQDVKENLEKVAYSARFALGLFFAPGTQIDVPWSAKYVKGDDCIVFISVDDRKRGSESATMGPSVAVHTNVPFGLKHIDEDKDSVCQKYVLPRLKELLPLPQPEAVKNHKWKYSQVFRPYEGSPGAIVLNTDPLLICAGDAFSHSNFDGCIESAETVLSLIKQAKLR